jgi:hypothetical protein
MELGPLVATAIASIRSPFSLRSIIAVILFSVIDFFKHLTNVS